MLVSRSNWIGLVCFHFYNNFRFAVPHDGTSSYHKSKGKMIGVCVYLNLPYGQRHTGGFKGAGAVPPNFGKTPVVPLIVPPVLYINNISAGSS